jgi:hypothetical protein
MLWCSACSVDPKAHKDYKPTCNSDDERIGELFCIPKAGKGGNGGRGGAGTGGEPSDVPDGGPDATLSGDGSVDAGIDAMVQESCTDVDAGDFCYPYVPMTTAFQPPCRIGTRTCGADHFWTACMDAIGPMSDTCDGVDNDCDGKTDEAQTQMTCLVGGGVKGVCAEQGYALCRAGKQDCVQVTAPAPEACNGKDDDCDDKTDEGLEVACYGGSVGCTANATSGYDCVPASTCAPGTLKCMGGKMQTVCMGDVRPATEKATKQNETPLDEDCDGQIDENFECQEGQEFPCYTGPANTRNKSPCKDGKQTCGNDGKFGACMDERRPVAESCANEGMDDDCDGMQDDVPRRGTSCSSASGAMGACKTNATWQCQAGSEVCRNGQMAMEVCAGNNLDEDCDGNVDEGFDLQSDEMNCGSCGNRCGPGATCCSGACVSTASSNSNCGTCGNICGTGLTCCSSNCVNLKSNGSNCGMCGKACLLGCTNGGCNLL